MMYHIIPVTNYMQNCTLIWCDDSKEAAIVDPGGDVETLIAEIEQEKALRAQKTQSKTNNI